MATTRGVPAEPARRQSEERSTSARARATPVVLAEDPESTIEQLRKQVIALQRISSLGVLAGGVFHELNNALTPILNYAKLGLRNPDPAYRERALKQIVESAERATTISRGMLGLARLGTGSVEREPADLSQLVEEVVLLVNKDLAKHRVRLEVKAVGNPQARVEPAQIQQVLINLLINARQAMPQGGVVRVRVGTAAAGRRVEISVSDNGVGIAPADLRRIFEPFYSTKKAPTGPDKAEPAWAWPFAATSSKPTTAASAPRAARARARHSRSSCRRARGEYPRRLPICARTESALSTLHGRDGRPPRPRCGLVNHVSLPENQGLPASLSRHILIDNPIERGPGSDRSMAGMSSVAVLRDIQTLFDVGTVGGLTDRQLLERFANRREASSDTAFEVLVLRHGPMVLRVCRNLLRDEADAADAFQATFLVLVRRRAAIRRLESVGGWLYGVACRVAARSRVDAAPACGSEKRAALRVVEAVDSTDDTAMTRDFGPIVQEEVRRLPERYRAVVVLCYWQSLTHEQAAARSAVRWARSGAGWRGRASSCIVG